MTSKPLHGDSRSVVYIARCPEHGLHGERTECFVCGGPVEQVPMVSHGDSTPAVLRAAADEIENLRAVGDRLQTGAEELIAFVERRFPKDEHGEMDAEAFSASMRIGNASVDWCGVRGLPDPTMEGA